MLNVQVLCNEFFKREANEATGKGLRPRAHSSSEFQMVKRAMAFAVGAAREEAKRYLKNGTGISYTEDIDLALKTIE